MAGALVIPMFILSLIQTAWSDYPCVCNYNVEKEVYSEKSQQATPIGYMYEFDCKAQYGSQDGDWISIAIEHQVGYIFKDGQIQEQVCSGNPPDEDLVTTTMAPITSTPLVTTTTTELPRTAGTLVSTTPITPTPMVNITTTKLPSTASTVGSTTPITSVPMVTTTTTELPSTFSTVGSTTVSTRSTTVKSTKQSTALTPASQTNMSTVSTQTTMSTEEPSTTPTLPPATMTSTANPTTLNLSTTIPSRSSTGITLTSPSTISSPQTSSIITSNTSPFTVKLSTRVTVPSTHTSTVSTTVQPSTKTTTVKSLQTTQSVKLSCQDLLKDVIAKDNGTLFAHGDKCFELLGIHTTWVNAELECRRKGGHLIDITNSNEQRVVYQVVNTYYHDSVWIGLHDMHHEEKFEWTTGKHVVYTNWYPGRKDSAHHWTEDCVAMGMNKYTGRWEDRPCNETRGFICQFDMNKPCKQCLYLHDCLHVPNGSSFATNYDCVRY